MFWLALFIFVVVFLVNYFGFIGLRTVKHLKDIESLENGPLVMAVKDEEFVIGESIQRLLDQSYQNLEVIIVNDRLQDNTTEIIDQFGDQIKAIHLHSLPEGWLGKNHACHCGANQATGKYLIFVDADSLLEPTTIGRAVRHMEDNDLDLMSAIYSLKDTGLLTRSIIFDNTFEGLKTRLCLELS